MQGSVEGKMMIRNLVMALALLVMGAVPASDNSVDSKAQEMLAQWKSRLNQAKLNSLVSGPFVVAGDCDRITLAAYTSNTILSAQSALRHMYLDKDRDQPVLILLIQSDAAYRGLAKQWLNEDQPSHFGFYVPSRRVMLMNVSTGTGTLVHELTHALVEPDFPAVPNWFNEGFASLFEQCNLQNGQITGLVNWRLAGLQEAIKQGKLRPLRVMIADDDFYGAARVGVNYAEARYLMLYLQEKGLLQEFYRRFRDHAKTDPTGINTLEAMVGDGQFPAFEQEWRRWVMKLRFG